MVICNQCGERLPEGKSTCPECGAVNTSEELNASEEVNTSEGVAHVSGKTVERDNAALKGENDENVTDTGRMRVKPEGSPDVIRVKVKRQDSTDGPSRWEEFD